MNTPARVNQLQDLLQILRDLGDEVAANPNISTEEMVALGQRLWAIRKRVDDSLNPIRDNLRAKGLLEANGQPGTRHFEAPDGSRCTVNVPPTGLQVKKDADMESLKVLLGPDFTELFEEVIAYKTRKDFQTRVPELAPDKAEAALGAVKVAEAPILVMFKE